MQVLHQLSHCVTARRFLRVWLVVVAVQILAEYIHSVMTVVHSVGIQHGHDHEDKVLSQHLGPLISLVKQKFECSVNAERGGHLARVDS